MKKMMLSLVIFLFLLLIGCQENSMTNPVSAESLNKANLNHLNTEQGTIKLDQKLADPYRVKDYFLLSGEIKYTDELLIKNPRVTATGYDVKTDISVDATLKNISSSFGESNTWKILSESQDLVYVTANGRYVLEKYYPVLGRTDKMELDCKFEITTDGVRLISVNLITPIV
jgi:hypothetical protein